MGKWTDKGYITHSEWSTLYGGAKAREAKEQGTSGGAFRRLPYDCCALSLRPFHHPVITPDGTVFDIDHLRDYLKKNPPAVQEDGRGGANAASQQGFRNPVTGQVISSFDDMTRLNFYKNKKGEYHCPVMMKVFNDYSHIVAIKPSGNVYSYEAVSKLCLERRHYYDLLDEHVAFTKKDILVIQDPTHLESRNLGTFEHVKDSASARDAVKAPGSSDVYVKGGTMKRIMDKLKEREESVLEASRKHGLGTSSFVYHNKSIALPGETVAGQANVSNKMSEGKVAASFTSTCMTPTTTNALIKTSEEDRLVSFVKENAYVTMHTNLGDLNIELWTALSPRAVFNFVSLAKGGYYNGVLFHRNVRNFMIQGGDPTGTMGKGGQSCWRRPFDDEFSPESGGHDRRGILSMANHGKDTNQSQFFITYKACPHLDGKHTVFGRVVGGLSTLDAMEKTPTNSDTNAPLDEISIGHISMVIDPYQLYIEHQKKKATAAGPPSFGKRRKADNTESAARLAYLTEAPATGRTVKQPPGTVVALSSKKETHPTEYGHFDEW